MDERAPLRLNFDRFELDEGNARLTRDGHPVPLPPKALAVLCTLARHPGQLVGKNALLDAVWGHRHVSESVLKTTISELRAALADDARRPRYIETASRFGYRFISPQAGIQPVATEPKAEQVVPALIGRQAALIRLRESWQRAVAGERQLVLLAGEAGIGKSTLIESLVGELRPPAVAHGQCIEHFGNCEPYLPLLEAIRDLCRHDRELPEIVRSVAPMWLAQMPWMTTEAERAALHRELAGAHPDRMVRELREVTDRYTAKKPLLLILEDLHWSDHATLTMLQHFARRPRPARMLWIGSYRLTQVISENHPLRDLRQELRLHALCDEILLDPFSASEVGAYLEQRFPDRQFDESFVRRVHAHTGGLPLFVANVSDALASASGSFSTAALPVPDTLTGAIDKQINRLPAEAQRVLGAASVYGTEFRASIVADMLEQSIQSVSDCCDALVRDGYWLRHVDVREHPDGVLDAGYSFMHALYTHALYQRLALPQRVHYHRRAALALERAQAAGMTVTALEQASHCERGQQFGAAIRHYARAAQTALDRFAPQEAVELTTHGLTLLPHAPLNERMELELALMAPNGVANAHMSGVVSAAASAAFERVQTLCDLLPPTPSRALLLNGLGLMFHSRGQYQRALTLGRRLDALAREHDNDGLRVLASTLLGGTLATCGEHARACEWLEQGIGIIEQSESELPSALFVVDSEVVLRTCIAGPLLQRGLIDQARSQLARALARATRIRQPSANTLVHWYGALMAARLHRVDEVTQHVAALADIMARASTRLGIGPTLYLQGWAEAVSGNPQLGLQHIREGHERQRELGMQAGDTEVLCFAAEALNLAREWNEARAQVEQALNIAEQRGEGLCVPALLLQHARAAAGQGDLASARDSLSKSVAEAQRRGALTAELHARVELAQLEDRTERDLEELAAVFGRMTEGLNTQLCTRARELLD